MVKKQFHEQQGELPGQSAVSPTAAAPTADADSRSPRAPKRRRSWLWSLVWLAMLGIFSGMGTAALVWLTSLPPPVDCRKPLTVDMDRLYCAEESARSGELPKLVAGVDLLKQWPPDHPLHSEAARLINKWSGQILVIAREKVKQSDLKGALEAISHIPKTSPVYKDAQVAVARWQKLWRQGEAIDAQAQAALKQQQWSVASEQVTRMTEMENDYWSTQRAGALAEQIGAEKRAWQALLEARRLAQAGTPAQLGAAIAAAQRIPVHSYTLAAAQADLKQWSQMLIKTAIQYWQQGDTVAAANVLQLPSDVAPTAEVNEVIEFGGAYRLMSVISSRWLPSPGQIWSLTEAIAAMQQIKSSSPFYAQAQAHLQNWQAQLKDTVQLQYASTIASLGSRSTYEAAIAQANQVQPNRPRYGQAQTLIAYWSNQVERIEDAPYLASARQLAQPGGIPDLQQAIAEANQIKPNRALRAEAQTLVSTWQARIETIEDQPFLNQARELADEGKLQDAIASASNINPGRALYAQAQTLITDWRAEQLRQEQIAADRPVLDRAEALADNGDLSAAITLAAQIGSGRALYGEAQSDVDRWQRRRDALLNPALPASPTPTLPAPLFPTPTPNSLPNGITPSPNTGLPSHIDLAPPSLAPSPLEVTPSPTADPSPPPASTAPRYEGYYDQRHYRSQSP